MSALILYGRRDCHLCEEMRTELAQFLDGRAVTVEEVDVDSDPALVRLHGARVPVLAATSGEEICHHFLDMDAVRRHLGLR